MAQRVRALVALAEDLGSVPGTHRVAHDCCSCCSSTPSTPAGFCGHQAHTQGTYTHLQKHPYTHARKNEYVFKTLVSRRIILSFPWVMHQSCMGYVSSHTLLNGWVFLFHLLCFGLALQLLVDKKQKSDQGLNLCMI